MEVLAVPLSTRNKVLTQHMHACMYYKSAGAAYVHWRYCDKCLYTMLVLDLDQWPLTFINRKNTVGKHKVKYGKAKDWWNSTIEGRSFLSLMRFCVCIIIVFDYHFVSCDVKRFLALQSVNWNKILWHSILRTFCKQVVNPSDEIFVYQGRESNNSWLLEWI